MYLFRHVLTAHASMILLDFGTTSWRRPSVVGIRSSVFSSPFHTHAFRQSRDKPRCVNQRVKLLHHQPSSNYYPIPDGFPGCYFLIPLFVHSSAFWVIILWWRRFKHGSHRGRCRWWRCTNRHRSYRYLLSTIATSEGSIGRVYNRCSIAAIQ